MSRLSMPRRGHRLAYEGNSGARAAPLRRPSRPAPSKLKIALKAMLLTGVLVVSSGGAFLGAQHFLPCQSIAPGPPRDEVEAYLARGERLLKAGDVATARLFFARAAEAGEARGAIAMAQSFEPEVLRTLRIYGIRPDLEQAASWRARAKNLEMTAAGR